SQAPARFAVGEEALQSRAERRRVPRRHEHPGVLGDDEVGEAPDGCRDDRLAVRHRLRADDSKALAPGWTHDDGSAFIPAFELLPREEAESAWHEPAKRA